MLTFSIINLVRALSAQPASRNAVQAICCSFSACALTPDTNFNAQKLAAEPMSVTSSPHHGGKGGTPTGKKSRESRSSTRASPRNAVSNVSSASKWDGRDVSAAEATAVAALVENREGSEGLRARKRARQLDFGGNAMSAQVCQNFHGFFAPEFVLPAAHGDVTKMCGICTYLHPTRRCGRPCMLLLFARRDVRKMCGVCMLLLPTDLFGRACCCLLFGETRERFVGSVWSSLP